MGILCVGNWPSSTGYAWWLMERFWEAIAKRYPGRVTISFPEVNGLSQRLKDSGANIVEHAFDPASSAEWARQNGFRYLYLTDRPYNCAGYAKLRKSGVDRIIVHDHTPGERSRARGIKRLIKTAKARYQPWNADAYIAVSDLVLKRFLDCVCLPAEKCYTAQNGIDLDIPQGTIDIRRELELPADAIVVASVSRVTKYKRVDQIVEAATLVKGAYFIHCGDGPDYLEFRDLVDRNSIADRFFFLGKRADVAEILASADIGVHASKGEVGTSLSILEFMRAGLPVVVPNSHTVSQAVANGRNGLLYEPDDVFDLARKLTTLIDNPGLRWGFREANRVDVRKYDINHTISSVLRVFESLRI